MNYIVIDTETTNGFDDPLCYDVGWLVFNHNGEVLESRSFVVADIFIHEPQLMSEAFFANKIPQYVSDIADGKRELRKFNTIRRILYSDCKKYRVYAIMAHNMRFDYLSTATTQRWLTKSKYRYFFPYGIELWDTLKMARQTFGKDKEYKTFCKENGYTCGNGQPRLTAEILYRYLSNNLDFEEAHTGNEDTQIEKEIYLACIEKNADIERKCWKD